MRFCREIPARDGRGRNTGTPYYIYKRGKRQDGTKRQPVTLGKVAHNLARGTVPERIILFAKEDYPIYERGLSSPAWRIILFPKADEPLFWHPTNAQTMCSSETPLR